MEGIKREVIGFYDSVKVEVLQGDRWLENYKGAEFPIVFKFIINSEEFWLFL